MLEHEPPESSGKLWAATVAEALLRRARSGDVMAFREVANRIEGKPLQAVAVKMDPNSGPSGAVNGCSEAHQ